MTFNLYTVSAFTKNGSGGNLAGVVLDADRFSNQNKQKIAYNAGFFETIFVSSSADSRNEIDFSVSFFTPTEEINLCGHATLASLHLLKQKQLIKTGKYTFNAKAGSFSVRISDNNLVTMQQLLPKTLAAFSHHEIAPLLNVTAKTLSSPLPFEVLSTGLSDVIIPVPFGALDNITPNLALIKKFCIENNIIGLHLFELMANDKKVTAHCRNFAPAVGIDEESATGSACGALACYLHKHKNLENFIFEQGRAMGSSSTIEVTVKAKDGQISLVEVSGFARLVKTEKLES